MELPIFIVDAFTSVAFRGNPAAVCLLEHELDDGRMQAIASEMNQPETAFVSRIESSVFRLRWFTPYTEVPLCGHATLAAAHVIGSQFPGMSHVAFETMSGTLLAHFEHGSWVLDFPSSFLQAFPDREEVESKLRLQTLYVGKSDLYWLAHVASEDLVRNYAPSFEAIKNLGLGGLILTSRSSSEADDFVSRFFAPALGVDEDHVTGSAHCVLAPYWSNLLGKMEMVGYQASQRGGFVRVEFLGARTLLKGDAVTILTGTLRL